MNTNPKKCENNQCDHVFPSVQVKHGRAVISHCPKCYTRNNLPLATTITNEMPSILNLSTDKSDASLNEVLVDEPDLNAEFAPGCTWAGKKRFCEIEARSYWGDNVPISDNPYCENTWPWKWFNDEYLRLCE